MMSIANNSREPIWQKTTGRRKVHLLKDDKTRKNSQEVTFNTAVADLRVFCAQMKKVIN